MKWNVFGEQTVVIPLESNSNYNSSDTKNLTGLLRNHLERYTNSEISVKKGRRRNHYTVEAHSFDIGSILGKKGKNMKKLEEQYGIRIEVREKKGKIERTLSPAEIQIGRKQIILEIQGVRGEVTIKSKDEHLGVFTVGRKSSDAPHVFT